MSHVRAQWEDAVAEAQGGDAHLCMLTRLRNHHTINQLYTGDTHDGEGLKTFARRLVLFVLVALAGCGGPSGVDPAIVRIYNILVLDAGGGAAGKGVIFLLNPFDGFRTVLNNLGDATQGPVVHVPRAIAVEASGQILVIDKDTGTERRGSLFRVDPRNKRRTLLSDFGNPSQSATPDTPLGSEPGDVAVEGSRQIVVVDEAAGTEGRGALFRVHPDLGIRELLSDFGNPAQGPLGRDPAGVAIETDGTILVADRLAETVDSFGVTGSGILFRVDPDSGMRTPLTFFRPGSTAVWYQPWAPERVAAGAGGIIWVTDLNQGVWRADPEARSLTRIGSSVPAGQLNLQVRPYDLAVEPSGTLVVVDAHYCHSCPSGVDRRGALFRGNPASNPLHLAVISDFGVSLPSENLGKDPIGVAILSR